MPVITEEDKDKSQDKSKSIVIDCKDQDDDDIPAKDKDRTDHDSEAKDFTVCDPDYDEDVEDQIDNQDPLNPTETSSLDDFKNNTFRKHAKELNELISKANFDSRRVAQSAAWRRHFARKAKSLNLKLLPLIPGYNTTRWNAEFDSLNWLVQACKIVADIVLPFTSPFDSYLGAPFSVRSDRPLAILSSHFNLDV
ncbi:uncharacterized protein MELLADRAFT_59745 [Melampsora larici-populina 98AG31]|uniref:Uncharacterized protein n=1 Tax=Melampsora larici-populina (strain 98AG31 / pathotype 3-4-7) TaxID=747676 RepID=F4R748_MELLP|nr:uncharacterized protein MELLADRAFT_59745 [Melampsora larici-populina 98AG31]EGG11577.1 hypothetical protein MELLADRAFT_59745 [Melampsora larici-populina 98AG31]